MQYFCVTWVLRPEFRYLIIDEMMVMLDPLTQAQTWTELMELTRERGIRLLMITHSPALMPQLCDDVTHLDRLNL